MKARLLGLPRGFALQLVLVDGNALYKNELQRLLRDHAYGLKLGSHYADLASWQDSAPTRVDALLLSDDLPNLHPSVVTQAFARGVQRVIILVTDPSSPILPGLRQAGASLVFKFSPGLSLAENILAVPPRVAGHTTPLLEQQAMLGTPADPMSTSRTVVVYSPSGGSGKTLLATHLAASYAQQKRRTALVDLAQFGGINPLLRASGSGKGFSIVASILAQEPDLANSPRFGEYLQQALLPVALGGGSVDLLPAPVPSKADQVRAEHVEAVLRTLRALQYDRIVVDTGSELGERTAVALTSATLIVVPVQPDFSAVYHCLQLRDILQTLDIPRNRVGMVLNRWRTDVAFSLEEFQELTRLPVLGMLPDAPRQAQGMTNRGKLITGRLGLAGALTRLLADIERSHAARRGG